LAGIQHSINASSIGAGALVTAGPCDITGTDDTTDSSWRLCRKRYLRDVSHD